ncbi:hypothetical protein G4X40_13595 [Rhodococcus sp. D2-41]|uniref:Phasin domain-containing protein n=1 Tax=Speluncibacter jeojiensis TaxID=2710754 RepID=A0A9X4REN7_9ACTN|nr:hypothetical protein [Rhodococcus sp. D2-41]MDG3011185.1 hypothetical protein [Rhodococcus sp. D2-41]MDG3015964.1 hypothetical protein [Corynebacteriales bacterium D3-21]
MATQTTPKPAATGANAAVAESVETLTKSFDENVARVQGLGEKFVDAAKQSGTLAIDAYDKAVDSVLDFNKSVAGATKLGWVDTVVDAQASLIKGISSAASTAARGILA